MLNYQFIEIEHCNMCSANKNQFVKLGFRLNQSQGLKPKSKTGIAISVMQCKNCELIFSNPQPIPNSISEQYNISPESYWEEVGFYWEDTFFERELNTVKKLHTSQANSKMKALDIGAGYGRCMLSLEKAGYDAFGFEPSQQFYDLAINKFKISPDRLTLSTLEDIDYPENYFDFITFGAVLEHLHNPAASLKKALSWLKPNGIIHVEVPSSRWFIPKIINFYFKTICRTSLVTHLSPMHSPFHHFEFSIKSFIENSKRSNYKLVNSSIDVCTTKLPINYFDNILKKYMKLTGTGMQLIVYLQKNKM